MRIKCFIRDLWDISCGWDERIPEEYEQRWESIRTDVLLIFQKSIARHVAPLGQEAAIITFTDASIDAYAASVYLRVRTANQWQTFLVFSKSRLAPRVKWKEDVTIPRLELLGLTIGVRISRFVRQSLMTPDPLPVHIFCDSTCVLSWIRSDKPMDRFTTNRVKEIRKIENARFWYVKSENNPADFATRGQTAEELNASQLWWTGPWFLNNPIEDWPQKETTPSVTSLELQGIAEKSKEREIYFPGTLLAGVGSSEEHRWTPCNIDAERFSNLQKLLRTTVRCLKFVNLKIWRRLPAASQCLHVGMREMFSNLSTESVIRAAEVKEALHLWIRSCQDDTLSDVRASMMARKPHQLCRDLNLKLDERAVLRCAGRLSNADLADEAVHPILLPKKAHLTRLIIADVHHMTLHSGVRHTLSELRRRFWIPQGRQAVQSVISKCGMCKRYRGHSFALPRMPPLPPERVARAKPFEYCGLDFAGPINIKLLDETRKCWICLFTCLVVRAVHLEWMLDCTAQSFIDCLSRFIARRGTPRKIISDNAAQFHLADRLFDRLWKEMRVDDQLSTYIASQGVEWTLTTEFAPWQGGIYERLVGIVKTTLRTQIGRKLLKFDQFITLLAEVEAVVNCRPITFVYTDLNSGHPLRPVDFLADLPTGTPSINPTLRPEGSEASRNLVRHYKDKQRKLDQYWKRWYSDYLLSIRERDNREHKNDQRATTRVPEVGEVVLVEDEEAPRGSWKVARITKLLGKDDVKAAEVVLPNRYSIRRPINKLYSLEIPTLLQSSQHTVEAESENAFDGFEQREVDEAGEIQQRFEVGEAQVADVKNPQTTQLLLAGL